MRMLLSLCVVVICSVSVATGQQPILKYRNGLVEIHSLPLSDQSSEMSIASDEWYSIFSIYTNDAYKKKIDQPIAGEYQPSGDKIYFKPTYPFAECQTYHAVFRPSNFFSRLGIERELSWEDAEMSFSIPAIIHATTTVQSIFPESAVLPQNLLRMHIYFSAPMMPGDAYKHIALIRDDGIKIEKAFLHIDQELWDAQRKRVTLLFDPGRIKRDLRSNIELGMALEEGEKYTLVIDSAWRDVHGNTLAKSISKTFFVSPPIRSKVSVNTWKIDAPLAGSLESIIITFDRPMDQGLAMKHIAIRNSLGVVSGSAEIINDSLWKFTPTHPWTKGEHMIVASPLLEDVAGNNLNNAFDLDLSKQTRVSTVEPIQVPVIIRDVNR